MEVFHVDDNHNLVIMPQIIEIKEFKDLFDSDNSKTKAVFRKQMIFVWFYADFSSPYVIQGLSDEDKLSMIKDDIDWKTPMQNKKKVFDAIDKYKDLNKTETLRLLEAAQNAINSIISYFDDLDMSEKTEKGVLVNNISQVMASLKNIGDVNKDIRKLKDQVLAEMTDGGRIKGGEELGLFEEAPRI